MPEQDFSNREIVLMFEQIKAELAHIKEQTTKTNGRLLKAEGKLENLGTFQTRVMTAWGLIFSLATILINKFL